MSAKESNRGEEAIAAADAAADETTGADVAADTGAGAEPPSPGRSSGASGEPGQAETGRSTNGGSGGQAREWLSQLQAMIESLANQAVPVVREIGAKAAELAAIAAEKAGPIAARAAEVTADAGTRFAERSRNLATDLRREAEAEAARKEGDAETGTDATGRGPRTSTE